ncbi:MAG: aminodeoxychorismate/anthranilate synthase component II [Clostridiaceae bacterium]|nr:aminodeoxychorismate/anthranilate synthase component II [Clostridiaceae bacterium]
MILIIDNYGSFSYNLAQMVGAMNCNVKVVRNDEMIYEEIVKMNPTHIIISSGPERQKKNGICKEVIENMMEQVPILGIGLGHQIICDFFGAFINRSKSLMHGKRSNIHIANGNAIFKGLPPVIQAARYNSHQVERTSLPDTLLIIAEDENEEVMGIKHRDYEVYGLQFHPESILTPQGNTIINNFLKTGGAKL